MKADLATKKATRAAAESEGEVVSRLQKKRRIRVFVRAGGALGVLGALLALMLAEQPRDAVEFLVEQLNFSSDSNEQKATDGATDTDAQADDEAISDDAQADDEAIDDDAQADDEAIDDDAQAMAMAEAAKLAPTLSTGTSGEPTASSEAAAASVDDATVVEAAQPDTLPPKAGASGSKASTPSPARQWKPGQVEVEVYGAEAVRELVKRGGVVLALTFEGEGARSKQPLAAFDLSYLRSKGGNIHAPVRQDEVSSHLQRKGLLTEIGHYYWVQLDGDSDLKQRFEEDFESMVLPNEEDLSRLSEPMHEYILVIPPVVYQGWETGRIPQLLADVGPQSKKPHVRVRHVSGAWEMELM